MSYSYTYTIYDRNPATAGDALYLQVEGCDGQIVYAYMHTLTEEEIGI